MAWCVTTLTNGSRTRVAVVLRGLMISQLIFCFGISMFCYNSSCLVLCLLKDIHKVTILVLCGLIFVQAYAMKLHYTSGLRLISMILYAPYWSRSSRLCRAWTRTGILMAVNGLLVYKACDSTQQALIKELSSSLKVGISQYLTEPIWKRLLDMMQVELSCCGADSPNDWHKISWLNIAFLNISSDRILTVAGHDGRVILPVTPYSCCTPRVLAACYHDPLQQSEWRHAWSTSSPLLSASLHTRGCVEAISAPLARAMLALKCFTVVVAIFQVLIVVLMRLLVRSACDAALTGDCRGVGRAALIGQVKPHAYQRPRAVSEMASSSRTDTVMLTGLDQRRRRRRQGRYYSPP